MKALKSLNICYKKNLNDEFSNHVSSFTNNLFEYEHHDELIELINTNEIHFVITKYNFELLKKIRVLNNQIQIIAILDELNHTHLLEGLELQYVKFVQNLDCINIFIDILKDCVKTLDSNKSNILNLGNDFIYDKYNKSLFKNNSIVLLTKKEILFFEMLCENKQRIITKDMFIKFVYEYEPMSESALNNFILRIRKRFGKSFLHTIPDMGYKFIL